MQVVETSGQELADYDLQVESGLVPNFVNTVLLWQSCADLLCGCFHTAGWVLSRVEQRCLYIPESLK